MRNNNYILTNEQRRELISFFQWWDYIEKCAETNSTDVFLCGGPTPILDSIPQDIKRIEREKYIFNKEKYLKNYIY